jgi:hypothetical protein
MVLADTALRIEKFSIPHVSGTQIESTFVSDRIFEHSSTSFTDSIEPKLHAIRMKIIGSIGYSSVSSHMDNTQSDTHTLMN